MRHDGVLRAYVIGQTPRPDLTDDLERRFPGTPIEVVGALDGLAEDDIEPCAGCAYPLETKLGDGRRVVVDAAYVEARLKQLIDPADEEVLAHLVLCAGPFPALRVERVVAELYAPVLVPIDVASDVLHREGHERLAVLVPFEEQIRPAVRKWLAAGFQPIRVHALTEKPGGAALSEWVATWAREADADAVVFDYVGFPSEALDAVAAETGLPVFDLGHLTLDLLADALDVS